MPPDQSGHSYLHDPHWVFNDDPFLVMIDGWGVSQSPRVSCPCSRSRIESQERMILSATNIISHQRWFSSCIILLAPPATLGNSRDDDDDDGYGLPVIE